MKIGDPYPGYAPSNVNKDAKYTLKRDEGRWAVQLRYDEGGGWQYLLWSHAHPDLVEKVNAVKIMVDGREGGQFYINEFRHILVPNHPGPPLYAGTHDQDLDFDYYDDVISPVPPQDVKLGDLWPGPHVGVAYRLAAGGADLYCHVKDPVDSRRFRKTLLSDFIGPRAAAGCCASFRDIKGAQGGRIYINEAGSLFAPVQGDEGWEYVYLGAVDVGTDPWFPDPLSA